MLCCTCEKPIEIGSLMVPVLINLGCLTPFVPDRYAHWPKCPEGGGS
jgi:hypothetical protein